MNPNQLTTPTLKIGSPRTVAARSCTLASCLTLALGLAVTHPTTAGDTPDFASCAEVLTPYKAVFVSSFRGIAMQGERDLQRRDDGTFVLSHRAKAFGSYANEESVFVLEDGRIEIQEYHYVQSLLGFKKEDHAAFDWQSGIVKTHGKRERELPLIPGTFDNLSQQLAIRCSAKLGTDTMQFSVVKRSKQKDYVFERVGEETIDTDLGPLDTIVYRRVRDTDKRTTRFWLAPELNHMLVRLHQAEKKDALDVTLELSEVTFEQ
jgi:hypothetical protein